MRGVAVGNTPGVLTETTADFAFALLMAAARRIPEAARYVRAGHWQTWGPLLLLGSDLHGATIGIVGLGRIGQAVARRAKGFGMTILYSSRTPVDPSIEAELGATCVSLPELLTRSDFVTLPRQPERRHAPPDRCRRAGPDEADGDPGEHRPWAGHRLGRALRGAQGRAAIGRRGTGRHGP